MSVPALNEIMRRTGDEYPEYPEDDEERSYIILYPEDYEGFGKDVNGNLALLVDSEQAEEIKRLAEVVIERHNTD